MDEGKATRTPRGVQPTLEGEKAFRLSRGTCSTTLESNSLDQRSKQEGKEVEHMITTVQDLLRPV